MKKINNYDELYFWETSDGYSKVLERQNNRLCNNLEIKFNDIRYGWINISILIDNMLLTKANISYVYNPLEDIIDTLYNLKHDTNGHKFKIIIDEEGPELSFSILNKGKNLDIQIIRQYVKDYEVMETPTLKINKVEFINSFKNNLLNFYENNIKEINNKSFKFNFNKRKARKL